MSKKEYQKRYREANKEKIKEYYKNYYEDNKEILRKKRLYKYHNNKVYREAQKRRALENYYKRKGEKI